MAFPTVTGQSPTVDSAVGGAASGGDSANTFHNFTYPTTVAGDMILVAGRVAVAGTVSMSAGAFGAFTITQDSSDGSDDVTFWAWAVANGTEGGNAVGVNHGNGRMVGVIAVINGAADPTVTPPQSSTVAVGTSTAPNPTTCTPTGGAKDYLWIWFGAWEGEQTLSKTAATNYTSGDVDVSCGTAGAVTANCQMKFGYRTNNAASEDPAAISISASDDWTAYCIAVHPAGATAYTIDAASGSYAVSGVTAGVVRGYPINAVPGSYAVTGAAATFVKNHPLNAASGAYAVTGAPADLLTARLLNAASGSYTVTGADATLTQAKPMNAEPGAYSVTGADAGLLHGSALNASSGAYAVTGVAASLLRGYPLTADPGTYATTGAAAAILKGYPLNAQSGSYTVTGADAAILASHILNCGPGAYTVTGADAALVAARVVAALPGTYTVTGIGADLVFTAPGAYELGADPGSYAIAGANATMLASRILSAGPGVYQITGADAEKIASYVLQANPGAYVISGADATLARPGSEPNLPAVLTGWVAHPNAGRGGHGVQGRLTKPKTGVTS